MAVLAAASMPSLSIHPLCGATASGVVASEGGGTGIYSAALPTSPHPVSPALHGTGSMYCMAVCGITVALLIDGSTIAKSGVQY